MDEEEQKAVSGVGFGTGGKRRRDEVKAGKKSEERRRKVSDPERDRKQEKEKM